MSAILDYSLASLKYINSANRISKKKRDGVNNSNKKPFFLYVKWKNSGNMTRAIENITR